jgi:hypothetical protein
MFIKAVQGSAQTVIVEVLCFYAFCYKPAYGFIFKELTNQIQALIDKCGLDKPK